MSDRLTPAQVETLREMQRAMLEFLDGPHQLFTEPSADQQFSEREQYDALAAAIAQAEEVMPDGAQHGRSAPLHEGSQGRDCVTNAQLQAAIRKIEALRPYYPSVDSLERGVPQVARDAVLAILRGVQEGT